MDKQIRLLNAEEIDVRVGAIYDKGITLLLYKDARVDMNILDETFGRMNWQRRHFVSEGNVFCEVSIRDDKGEWISKTDVGTASFSEPVKGASSDSFKRACTNHGIGRELYTAPFIWVPSENVNLKEFNGKKTVKDSFKVQTIMYDEDKRTIQGLVIVNQNNQVVYQHMNYEKRVIEKQSAGISEEQKDMLLKEMQRTGISLTSVLRKHKLTKVSDMGIELWKTAMDSMRDMPTKEVA